MHLDFHEIDKIVKPYLREIHFSPSSHISYTHLAIDSRKVEQGGIFFAVQGTTIDGWSFFDKAIEKGAKLIIGEKQLDEEKSTFCKNNKCTYIQVKEDTIADSIALIAQAFWSNPSEKMQIVGVTGTNGKTTTATLLYQLMSLLGYKCGLIGTIENRIGDKRIPSTHTTPDSLSLNELLYEMSQAQCTFVFMEVSSHSLVQKRIAGVSFRGAIFTNISRDHLDYHGSMKEYIKAKKSFFDNLSKDAFALVNADDKNGSVMLQNSKAKSYTYSLERPADFRIKVEESDLFGTQLIVENQSVWTSLVGCFNAYNLGVVFSTARLLLPDLALEDLLSALSRLHAAEGRFEVLSSGDITAVVDYAHTPDALEKVLTTIHPLLTEGGRLICVVGAGGNRDAGKRPLMAQEAYKGSDLLILTSDNPRYEDPQKILDDMFQGIVQEDQTKVTLCVDRKEAIEKSVQMSKKGDVILVAGKGHETYQEIRGERHHFDDREILREFLSTKTNKD